MTPALNRYHEHLCVYLQAIDTRQNRSAQPPSPFACPLPRRDWFQWLGIDPNHPESLHRPD